MDDSFKLRVANIFGSLTSSPSQQRSSLWSLTDGEVQRREWKRGDAVATSDRDDMPCSSSFDQLKKDRRRRSRRMRQDDVDDDDDDDDEERRRGGIGGDGVDDWDIRSSIGLDRTLDNEEEEDEYDKVASGTDNGGRIYMNTINNQEAYLNIHNVIPNSSFGSKDRRANYQAAKNRIQEDEDEARNLNSPHVGETESKEPHAQQYHKSASELRPILKRKDNSSDSRSQKRVRFDPGCKIISKEESNDETQAVSMDSSSHSSTIGDNKNILSKNIDGVPDYLRNPSKYTCYSFDSSTGVEEESNSQACMNFLNMVKVIKTSGSESDLEDASFDLPKSVTFIPKKKEGEPVAVTYDNNVKQDENNDIQSVQQHTGFQVGIAIRESETNAMEEDEPGTNTINISAGSQKSCRKYRMKLSAKEATP
ncbi:hypothetical protein M5689_008527 [Euphorbia peplus]|nr:hypothetical protein M5689_008527 [Euphorbia peplus]